MTIEYEKELEKRCEELQNRLTELEIKYGSADEKTFFRLHHVCHELCDSSWSETGQRLLLRNLMDEIVDLPRHIVLDHCTYGDNTFHMKFTYNRCPVNIHINKSMKWVKRRSWYIFKKSVQEYEYTFNIDSDDASTRLKSNLFENDECMKNFDHVRYDSIMFSKESDDIHKRVINEL